MALEAGVDVVCDEEGYVEVGEAEELGEFEHGVDWALEGQREDENVWRWRFLIHRRNGDESEAK